MFTRFGRCGPGDDSHPPPGARQRQSASRSTGGDQTMVATIGAVLAPQIEESDSSADGSVHSQALQ
jgi:hypothetical protein